MTESDVRQFCLELEAHIALCGLDVEDLYLKSGMKFPLYGNMLLGEHLEKDWESLCYLSLWIRLLTGSIPGEFVSRMYMGPSNNWVKMLLDMGLAAQKPGC
jgi:hypothetical protein